MSYQSVSEKFLVVNKNIHRALIGHYDLYKKVIQDGHEDYVLSHRKGTPVSHAFPDDLYICESDIIYPSPQSVPERKIIKTKPFGQIATLMITKDYESKILNNPELDIQEKIELTVHCSCQVMRSLFQKSSLAENDFEMIRQVGYSFLGFTELILQENEAVEILVKNLMGCSINEYNHSVHVSLYAGILASELNSKEVLKVDSQRLKNLYIGTLLHDMGKTKIRPEILHKNGRLNQEEYEVIKKHPLYGIEIVESADFPREAREIILYHHEKWSGGGYPFNINYQSIPVLARIASICDVFDALTTRREYRQARKPFEALVLMKKKMLGAFYHPYLDVFIQVLGSGSQD